MEEIEYYWYLITGCAIALLWFLKPGFVAAITPSYEELLEEKNSLRESVTHWTYPDGSPVPQSQRERLFKRLNRLSRKIRRHPDNPDNWR